MMHSIMKNKRALQTLLAVCFWLAVWQIAAMAMQQEFLLASPLRVLQRLVALAGTAEFWVAVAVSIGRILMGFVLAVVGGVIIAAATARWRLASVLMQPLLSTVKAVPVASFILLALLWLDTGAVPVFSSFIMVLPMVWSNVEQGIRQTDQALLEMARCYRFSRWKLLKLADIPSGAGRIFERRWPPASAWRGKAGWRRRCCACRPPAWAAICIMRKFILKRRTCSPSQ